MVGGGQYCTCSSCAGGHSVWGVVLAVGFNILVYIAMPTEVRCVCVRSAHFLSAMRNLIKEVLGHLLELWHPCGHTATQRPY